jgi:hypothetical protein
MVTIAARGIAAEILFGDVRKPNKLKRKARPLWARPKKENDDFFIRKKIYE